MARSANILEKPIKRTHLTIVFKNEDLVDQSLRNKVRNCVANHQFVQTFCARRRNNMLEIVFSENESVYAYLAYVKEEDKRVSAKAETLIQSLKKLLTKLNEKCK